MIICWGMLILVRMRDFHLELMLHPNDLFREVLDWYQGQVRFVKIGV